MARTIEEIKNDIGIAFVENKTLQDIYGLDPDISFEKQFSRASIEGIIVYIVAYANYVLERLFDTHRDEVEERIRQMKPHTLRWYVSKVKMFRYEQTLIDGTDTYGDTDSDGVVLTEERIADMQVVKFAAATESLVDTVSIGGNDVAEETAAVYIKVAGEDEKTKKKKQLEPEEIDSLLAYIREIKDAGVRVVIINGKASRLKLSLLIHYNPMVLDGKGKSRQKDNEPVVDVIKDYIQNLPFNGEYRNVDLIDRLKAITGVVIATLRFAEESNDEGTTWKDIEVNAMPYAGYYEFNEEGSTIEYRAYEGKGISN